MSFWKRKLLGLEDDKLPESSSASQDCNEGAPVPEEEPIGPPPTATAYSHTVTPSAHSTPKPSTQQPEPPNFQIFQPKQKSETQLTNAYEDTTPSIGTPQQVVESTASEEHDTSSVEPQQEEDDMDFDELETPQEMHTLENITEEQEFETVSQSELLQETPMQTELIQENLGLSPKFEFLNESVPLQTLADTRSKRRHESLARIHELDCKLASLQAKLAHESMDRAIVMANITIPLEAAIERFGSELMSPSDGRLQARLLKLESDMMKHLHVTLPDAIYEMESPQDYVTQELQACLKLETNKADKREGSMVRRFESIAGTAARRYSEETASRCACLAHVQSLAQDAADLDEQRSKEFLESLQTLRESLRREREERKAQDKRVMDLIVERTAELQRALLEAAECN